ncbi:MAG: YbaB/EbfC family nucleoid-associated protein [candidate division WOR-3 bacterium]|nr:YbaB/EbfC family nucleoid-associated protein [candidate division WOR-3 bacterium]
MMNFDFKKLAKIQETINQAMAKVKAEASAGGDMVKAVADGYGNIVSIKIEPELLKDLDLEMLQDLIVAAVNEAKNKAKEEVQKEIERIIGFPLPPFPQV